MKIGFIIEMVNKMKKEFWLKRFYNELVDLSTILKNSDGKARMRIILDLLFLVVITCILKIPFIFIRDLGDNVIEALFSSDTFLFALWGLLLELVYVVVALSFFIKTFEKWFKNMK